MFFCLHWFITVAVAECSEIDVRFRSMLVSRFVTSKSKINFEVRWSVGLFVVCLFVCLLARSRPQF